MKNFKKLSTAHGRYAVLRSDFMMKKVFSHKELLLSFINAVIPDKNFVDLTFNSTQQLADKKEFGSSIYDVYCTTSTREEIVVELQNIKQLNFTDRILFYSTYLIQKQRKEFNRKNLFRILKKEWTYDLRPVIIISIVNFKIFSSFDDDYLYSFHVKEDSKGYLMSDKLRFIYLELPAFLKDEKAVNGDLETWTYLFNNMEKLKNPPVKMSVSPYNELFNLSEIANFAEKEYNMYLRRQKEIDDKNSQLAYAYSDGKQQGRVEGRAEEKLETAKRMKGKSYTINDICELTDLDRETVEKL